MMGDANEWPCFWHKRYLDGCESCKVAYLVDPSAANKVRLKGLVSLADSMTLQKALKESR